MIKNLPAMQKTCLIPGLGRFPGEGNDYPLQYSGLENSMDRGAWKVRSMGSQRVGYDFLPRHFTFCILTSIISPCYSREGDRQLLYFSESITLLYVSSFLSSSNKHIPYRIRYTCIVF